MVYKAAKLGISEDNTAEDADDDSKAVWLIVNTGIPEVFLVEADGFEVDSLLTAFTPNL